MNWDDLRYLLALAEGGSLSAASARLRVSPSTVSRRIEVLEQSVGAALFRPHREGYALTDFGRSLIPAAERAAAEFHRFEQTALGPASSACLRIEAPELLAHRLLPAVGKAMAAVPGLQVEMRGSVSPARLLAEEADLVLRLVRPEQGNYRLRKVGRIAFGLYGAPGLALPRARSELVRHPLIGWPEDHGLLLMSRWMSELCPSAHPTLRLSTLTAQLHAAQLGLGWAVLPDFAARPLGLVQVHFDATTLAPDLWLLTRTRSRGPAVNALSDAIVAELTAL